MATSTPPTVRLLIVDDDEQMRGTLVKRFQHLGMTVTSAASEAGLLYPLIPPLKARPPFLRDAVSHGGEHVWKRVFLVARDRIDMAAPRRFHKAEVRQTQDGSE
jgi:hypothetical protein